MTTVRRAWIGDLEISDYPYGFRFGADLGNADADVVTLESLLADGQIESLVRRLNRGMSLGIVVDGADLAEVQANEAALVRECDRAMNTLTIDPGDGYAQPMVFETTVIDPQRVTGDGSDERDMANMHLWTLAIKAQPFWRSTTEIIDDAGTPPSSGGTLLYNCESTTGWADWNGGTPNSPTVDSVIFAEGAGSIRTLSDYSVTAFNTSMYHAYWTSYSVDQVTGKSWSTGAGGYMSLAVRIEYADLVPEITARAGLDRLYMQIAGAWVEVPSFVAASLDEAGFVHYVWPVDAGLTVTGLRMGVRQIKLDKSGTATDGFLHAPYTYTWYDDVELLPAATTDHQIVKQLTVQGSARTTGSLRVSAPSESVALGEVLAITAPTDELPAGFQPDGRRWVTQGTTTSDGTALHGSYFTPDAASYSTASGKPIFDAPVNMLTAGPYSMVALVKAEASSLTFGVQAQLRIGSTDVGPVSVAETSPSGLTTGWQLMTVGTVYLPPVAMEGADDATSRVRLLFKGAKFADVFFIPAWQVGGQPVADFSIIDCGTGTVGPGLASSSLWLDSPSPANGGRGAWMRGPTTDRRNAQAVTRMEAKKPGIHSFRPGGLTAFLVSLGAAGPTLTLRYYDRYL